jgi:hypothetical protein
LPAYPLLARRDPARPTPFVRELGLVAPAFATIQIDLNPVSRQSDGGRFEVTLCDHNCTTEVDGVPTGGHYTCPAAISLNRGAGRGAVAPTDLLAKGLRSTISGIRRAQERFLADDLPRYLDDEGVPESLRPEFEESLREQKVIVNLFGGSPELHPGCLDLVEDLHAQGAEVHLTTTGRRILQDEKFRADFLRRPPDLLALGADDFESAENIEELFAMDYDELGRAWRKVPWTHGQRKKAIEAVQLCLLARSLPFPPLLFNIVLHSRNIAEAPDILDRLGAHVPAVLNPYPVQSAFLGEPGELHGKELALLREFAARAVDVHAVRLRGDETRWNLAPRLAYWILMLSLLTDDVDDVVRSDRVGGDGVWQCYRRSGAGRCVQVGIARPGSVPSEHPGGHLGCFWNVDTVQDDQQFWNRDGDVIGEWIQSGRQAAASSRANPCRGCLFPRMSMDAVSLELGLTPQVSRNYRSLRAHYLGY